MNSTEEILQRAEQKCRSHGSRLTIKRKYILSGLVMSGKAMSAYELVDFCQKEYAENIPAMSVYRILDFLQEENLVHKLKLANKYVACSHISCGHSHEIPQFLICSQCNEVKEINIKRELLEDIRENVEQANYKLLNPQIELSCLCKECTT